MLRAKQSNSDLVLLNRAMAVVGCYRHHKKGGYYMIDYEASAYKDYMRAIQLEQEIADYEFEIEMEELNNFTGCDEIGCDEIGHLLVNSI